MSGYAWIPFNPLLVDKLQKKLKAYVSSFSNFFVMLQCCRKVHESPFRCMASSSDGMRPLTIIKHNTQDLMERVLRTNLVKIENNKYN